MSKEEKYKLVITTIYNTLKQHEWEFTLKDKYIIKQIIKYIEVSKDFIEE